MPVFLVENDTNDLACVVESHSPESALSVCLKAAMHKIIRLEPEGDK